jgi:membrane peptidoglycan carboxypeptidase
MRARPAGTALPAFAALLALTLGACADIVILEPPDVEHLLVDAAPTPRQSTIVDPDGRVLAVLRREHREPASLSAMPKHLVDAVLVAEDRRFHHHRGIDGRSLARAALVNLASGEIEQGGSTITQQLVKLRYLADAERTPETKLQEAILARRLEREHSKAEILEEYLNTVYLGQGATGVHAAAHTYFRVPVEALELHQSALLAAIIRAPEALSPLRAPDQARRRRDDVLWRMAADDLISVEERDAATAAPIEIEARPPAPATHEPHLVDLVLRTLRTDPRLGPDERTRDRLLHEGGLTIHTTVRPELQTLARRTLAEHLDAPGDPDAAIAAVDPATGHVLAIVGTRSYDELQFDLATQARRQPGSTFKVVVLAAAIANGWRPWDVLDGDQGDIEHPAGVWEDVRNYDRRSYGRVTLAGAARVSINTAFVRLGLAVGLDRVAGMGRALGISSPIPGDEPQITIGGGRLGVTPLDMASVLATLANDGVHMATTVVSRIEDPDGRVIWEAGDRGTPALTPSAAWVTLDILRDVVARGTGRRAQVDGWQVAGKTGTSSDHVDAWFVGTTPVLAAAVWIGHAEGRVPLLDVQGVDEVTGGTIPAEIFARFVADALADRPPQPFLPPTDDFVIVEIDPETGLLAAPWCPGTVERIPSVLVPRDTCPLPEVVDLPDDEQTDPDGGSDDGEEPADPVVEDEETGTGEGP